MLAMAATEPGEQGAVPDRASRRLAEAPSARYRDAPGGRPGGAGGDGGSEPSALPGPLLRAVVVAVVGAALLWLVGAALASTAGLLFVCGVIGATVGLVLSRAAAPLRARTPVPRRTVIWLSIVLVLAAIVVADVLTWRFAIQEGGTLGLIDYLFTTFGPFVPGELIVGLLGAWWGASSGPIQS
jgi:hypothetical protein